LRKGVTARTGRLNQVKLAVAAATVIGAVMEDIEETVDDALARESIHGAATATGASLLCREQFASHCHSTSSDNRFV
jgi:hypothetical protein